MLSRIGAYDSPFYRSASLITKYACTGLLLVGKGFIRNKWRGEKVPADQTHLKALGYSQKTPYTAYFDHGWLGSTSQTV